MGGTLLLEPSMLFARQVLRLCTLLAVGTGVCASTESSLTSVGASLPARLYSEWFARGANSGGVKIQHRSVGSVSARWALIRQTVDLAVSTAPMQPRDLAKVRRGVVQIPVLAEAIAFAYNQPGCDLKLTQKQAVQVASGMITDWEQLGCKPGAVSWVHRSDPSGITNAFTLSMQAFSSQWSLGTGTLIRWQADNALAAKGNSGVVAALQNKRGAIGYVGASMLGGGIRTAALENGSGEFIQPDGISAAAYLKGMQLDSNLAGIDHNPSVDGSYPIVTLIWVLAYRSGNGIKTEAIRDTVDVMLSRQAQSRAEQLGLIPLNDELLSKSRAVVEWIGQ
ncbi:PstS family phosphate ABC transporter substrate-binding protein [Synechococcus sp. MIT S9503]|uniref:PstS family phosphate ABC transporter substrate-binding protein n=1 Tax=Synechococcus sp. MIT S9503 TaxID=3082547 RepID=UPI0039A45317